MVTLVEPWGGNVPGALGDTYHDLSAGEGLRRRTYSAETLVGFVSCRVITSACPTATCPKSSLLEDSTTDGTTTSPHSRKLTPTPVPRTTMGISSEMGPTGAASLPLVSNANVTSTKSLSG